MGYRTLNQACLEGEKKNETFDLKSAAVQFIHNRCEDLRFDPKIEAREAEEGKYYGTSTAANQVAYNQQMDVDRLCLENALKRFLDSGAAQDAFDVYFCYLEMFVGNYKSVKPMIEMLSEFESNGSSLLMKHRDHYSHSVYVFALGLAVYETNSVYRNHYKKMYQLDEEHQAAHHFLEYWGLASLFHDIGYPFELPFEQVESYFEVKGEKRSRNPFVVYLGMENFISIDRETQNILQELYQKNAAFANTNELFSFALAEKLGEIYHFTQNSIQVILETKPCNPNRFGYFMDHAYFSASVLFQELCAADRMENRNKMTRERIDALTAILLHNSLYKFSVAFYKDKQLNIPLNMEVHPLAYMLMLCDELQCWDRTSYGRNSRTELHPMDCEFSFHEKSIEAVYIYDEAEKSKIDKFEQDYQANKKAKLKAYSSMVHENTFFGDIAQIICTDDLGLSVSTAVKKANHKRKHIYLSDSNFIHLYNFAVALNARYSYQGKEETDEVIRKMEEEFNQLSLEYKLSNIGQAKAFAAHLDAIHCFYTDKPVDFEMITAFDDEDLQIIGPLEHSRWLKEHQEMGWKFGDDYHSKEEREQRRVHKLMMDGELTPQRVKEHYEALPLEEQNKDTEPMNSMLKLMKNYEGLRIYKR